MIHELRLAKAGTLRLKRELFSYAVLLAVFTTCLLVAALVRLVQGYSFGADFSVWILGTYAVFPLTAIALGAWRGRRGSLVAGSVIFGLVMVAGMALSVAVIFGGDMLVRHDGSFLMFPYLAVIFAVYMLAYVVGAKTVRKGENGDVG